MRDLNKVFLLGRLGTDPTLRTTKNGMAVASFSLATSKPKRSEPSENPSEGPPENEEGETGEDHEPSLERSGEANARTPEDTTWHRVVVWGKMGQNCAQFLKKGETAMVEGAIRRKKYKGGDGVGRYSFEVHAESVLFLGGGASRKMKDRTLSEEVALAET